MCKKVWQVNVFSMRLLDWYDKERRTLPWRTSLKNPYHTWLSEIMLQQTTVATVIPYFNRFIEKWPRVQDLANASIDEVLTEWQGLGYYSRARNLHKCAALLAQDFPDKEEGLLKLPGIGPYTAAAIVSIAFEQPATAIDGNVIRVMSRYSALPKPKPTEEVKQALETLLPTTRFGDFTQALMELGALICRPKTPLCEKCPLSNECLAFQKKETHLYPLKRPKQKLPTRYATAFIIKRNDGAILLRKRPDKGLLGGMMEVPSTPWETTKSQDHRTKVKHTFTHFHLEMGINQSHEHFEGIWILPQDLKNYALPTVMKKILKAGAVLE
jgi:A/G-specific adenine glycosylase